MGEYERVWNETYGMDNDPIRKFVLFPKLLELNRDFEDKTILDVGCGNGSLINRILEGNNPKEVVGIDISRGFLDFARAHIKSERLKLIECDIRKEFPLKSDYFDIVYSVFVLGDIDKIEKTISEICRTMKKNGKFYMILHHPSYALSMYLYEKYTGEKNKKILGIKGYFERVKAEYVLSIAKKKGPHYHRPLEDYIKLLIKNNLRITNFLEFTVNEEAMRKFPRYKNEADIPKFLIIESKK